MCPLRKCHHNSPFTPENKASCMFNFQNSETVSSHLQVQLKDPCTKCHARHRSQFVALSTYTMFFSLAALGVLTLASPGNARLGDNNAAEAAGSAAVSSETVEVGTSGNGITFDASQISALITNELSQEFWVPKKKFFKKSPFDYYDEEDLYEIPGVQHTNPGDENVFDMSNRATGVGYRITAEESGGLINNYQEFTAWAGSNLNLQQYAILPRPSLQSTFHWLSSPGLRPGDFRIDTLGSSSPLPFREVARPVKSLFTRCPSSGLPLAIFVEIVGNRFSKIPCGTTVWELLDSFGNSYFLGALRGVNPQTGQELPGDALKLQALHGYIAALNAVDNNSWTLSQRTLEEDFEYSCLFSSSIPKNKKGKDGIVCKQLQVMMGPSQVAFGLAEVATGVSGKKALGFPDLVTFNPMNGQCAAETMFLEA